MRCILLSFTLLLTACSPLSVTFTLGQRSSKLERSDVLTEGKRPREAKVALIDVRGVIADDQRGGLFSAGENPVDALATRLNRAKRESDVKAVVLRINSPGGSVTASDTMYNEVLRFREETGKPVVALYGEVAASGGYYLSLAADEIVTAPTTITGSIGVIFPTINVSGGMNRIGIVSRAVVSGPNKDMANPLEPMEEGHYVLIQGMVDEMYARFRSLVLERRPALADGPNVAIATDGRIMTGVDAVAMGLADHEGDVRTALRRAMDLASLEGATLVKYHARGGAVRSVYSEAPARPAGASETLRVTLPGMDQVGTLPSGLYYLWLPGTR